MTKQIGIIAATIPEGRAYAEAIGHADAVIITPRAGYAARSQKLAAVVVTAQAALTLNQRSIKNLYQDAVPALIMGGVR
ncbi:hypothetical protein [Arthrobacter woluwensis]|uniref:hypothetical protein n=1 Tax=Arthrobacter woluwensis TaxID=156980 RepID=UPI001AAFC545|nr:hypothetical protein [Arthrobacter woluwensis]QTF71754.1 hypothetical protein G8758_06875 [Arthrobacter woluwensis]